MKKILLSIGTVAAAAAPIATIVACGKSETVSTIVELSPLENGKYKVIKINLDFEANASKANQDATLNAAKNVFKEQKNNFDDSSTKVFLKTSENTIEKTYKEFKDIQLSSSLPSELKVKDESINKRIQVVLNALVAAAH